MSLGLAMGGGSASKILSLEGSKPKTRRGNFVFLKKLLLERSSHGSCRLVESELSRQLQVGGVGSSNPSTQREKVIRASWMEENRG
ncbi:hypothetical protein LINPERHAP2_LOCUS43798 [Linum perenne]